MRLILKEINHVGVLTIELFETGDNLIVNEIELQEFIILDIGLSRELKLRNLKIISEQ